MLPPLVRIVPLARVLPPKLADRLMGFFGVNVSMDHFHGH